MTDLTNLENRMVIDEYWQPLGEPSYQEYDPSDEEFYSDEELYSEYIPLKDNSDDR